MFNRLLAVLAVVLLSACTRPEAAFLRAPLAAPDATPVEEPLLGTWYAVGMPSTLESYFALLTLSEGRAGVLWGAYSVSILDEEWGIDWLGRGRWKFHATRLDGVTYYSGRLVAGRLSTLRDDEAPRYFGLDGPTLGETGPYILVRFEIDAEGNLVPRVLGYPPLQKRGIAETALDCGGDCRLPVFDISSAALAELVGSVPEDELFTAVGRFRRIALSQSIPPLPSE